MRTVPPACDAAIVVCEADDRKVPALELVLRELEEADIPRFLFLNKIDTASRRVRETVEKLQTASRTPLLLRQIPDLEERRGGRLHRSRAGAGLLYRDHAPSEAVAIPADEQSREKEARFSMLERLADYDDALMEDLVEEHEPPRERVFGDLARELKERHVVPVLIGAADRGNGVTGSSRRSATRRRRSPRRAPPRRRRRRASRSPR